MGLAGAGGGGEGGGGTEMVMEGQHGGDGKQDLAHGCCCGPPLLTAGFGFT